MSIYINYCQKGKENFPPFSVFSVFLFSVCCSNDLKSGITEQNPSVTLDEVCKIKRLKQNVHNFSPHSDQQIQIKIARAHLRIPDKNTGGKLRNTETPLGTSSSSLGTNSISVYGTQTGYCNHVSSLNNKRRCQRNWKNKRNIDQLPRTRDTYI